MTREARLGARTILLVDDEEMVRASTARLLTRHGYRVIAARDGRAALALIDEGTSVDLLLTDIVMPEIYGTELVRMARERVPGLPVLLMSGFADQRNPAHDAIPAGVPFLSKPFSAADLLAEVRALIGGPA